LKTGKNCIKEKGNELVEKMEKAKTEAMNQHSDINNKNGVIFSPEISGNDQELVERSVRFINDKANETLYKGALEIGSYILKHFFNNDIVRASSKNPKKINSYKKLCRHRDLAVPYSTLTVMVRVAAQEKFLTDNQVDVSRLGYTHRANLIRLDNNAEKLALAQRCIAEGLSTRKLSELIKKKRQVLAAERKDEQANTAFQNIMKIERLIGRSEKSELITDIDKIRSMQAKTREDLREKATALLEIMSQTTKDCRKILKNLGKVEKEKQ
jgi:hypothetical protein